MNGVRDRETPARNATERILWAAIELFGEHGFARTSLKSIAQRAEVSPPLVIHHFGSKAGLRTACDRRLAEEVRAAKTAAVHQDTALSPLAAMSRIAELRPLLRYLARALVDRSPELDDLLDRMVDDAMAYSAEAEEAGWMTPSSDPRGRMVVLTIWSLGALTLHEQLRRMLDVDLLGDDGDMLRYIEVSLELFTQGFLDPQAMPTSRADRPGDAGEPGQEEETS